MQLAWKAYFTASGAELHSAGPQEFAFFIKAENKEWLKLIRDRKLQLD